MVCGAGPPGRSSAASLASGGNGPAASECRASPRTSSRRTAEASSALSPWTVATTMTSTSSGDPAVTLIVPRRFSTAILPAEFAAERCPRSVRVTSARASGAEKAQDRNSQKPQGARAHVRPPPAADEPVPSRLRRWRANVPSEACEDLSRSSAAAGDGARHGPALVPLRRLAGEEEGASGGPCQRVRGGGAADRRVAIRARAQTGRRSSRARASPRGTASRVPAAPRGSRPASPGPARRPSREAVARASPRRVPRPTP